VRRALVSASLGPERSTRDAGLKTSSVCSPQPRRPSPPRPVALSPRRPVAVRQAVRHAREPRRAQLRVVVLNEEAPRRELRRGEQVSRLAQRVAGHAAGLGRLEDLGLGAVATPGRQQRVQLAPVALAGAAVGKMRVGRPIRVPHHREPAAPLVLLARRDRDPAVAARQERDRRVRRGRREVALDPPGPLVGAELRLVLGRDGLLEREIDVAAPPAPLGRQQPVHRRGGRHLAAQEGRGVARGVERRQVRAVHLLRREAVGEAGRVEGDQVIPAPGRPRPPLAERRHRDQHQARIGRAQRLEAELEAIQFARREAFQHQVDLRRQLQAPSPP
jgi:hypothetical protein